MNCADGNDFPTKANNMWSSAHPGGDETVSVEPEQGGCDKYQVCADRASSPSVASPNSQQHSDLCHGIHELFLFYLRHN